jgi:hypothetical protein
MVKLWTKSDHKYGSYDVQLIFKMAAAAILYFRLSRFRWHFRTLLDGTVLCWKLEQNRTINTVVMTYNWFSRWRPPPSCIFVYPVFDAFSYTARWYGAMVKFEQNRTINTVVMTYNWFSRWRPPPSCIFVYPVFRWHFRTLLDGTVLCWKLEQNRTINTVVITYNWFSRWRPPPSCIFVYFVFDCIFEHC